MSSPPDATILHELPPSTPKFDAMTEDEKHAVVQKLQTTLSVKNEVQNLLAGKYDAQVSFMTSQDLAYVEAGDDETKFVGHVSHFLKEVDLDNKNYGKLTGGNQTLINQLDTAVADLKGIQEQTGWTRDHLLLYAEAEVKIGDISFDAMAKSAGVLADASKEYVNKLDGTAAAYIQAWDRTKHNERKKETAQGINTFLDLITGFGIGANAIVQFTTREMKQISGTFDRITNGYWLRAGQVGDFAQAVGNAGYSFKNFQSPTTPGILREIQGNTDEAGKHITSLTTRFKEWMDEYNKPPPPGDGGWYIPTI